MKRTLLLSAALGLCAAAAAPEPDAPTIDGLNLGTYWYGKPVETSDLLGKVVLVEIWGS